jgi:phosphoribosylaminoimidazole carboxylase
VAIGNAANAGLLAARIVAAYEPHIMEKMIAYQVRNWYEIIFSII